MVSYFDFLMKYDILHSFDQSKVYLSPLVTHINTVYLLLHFYGLHYYRCPRFLLLCPPPCHLPHPCPCPPIPLAIPTLLSVSMGYACMFSGDSLPFLSSSCLQPLTAVSLFHVFVYLYKIGHNAVSRGKFLTNHLNLLSFIQ